MMEWPSELPCLRGRIGVVICAIDDVCAISLQVDKKPTLVLALTDLVYFGTKIVTDLKLLIRANRVKFDAVRDIHSSFGSFWKAIHVWTDAKVKDTNPDQDWFQLEGTYNSSQEKFQVLLSTYQQTLTDFLLNGTSLEEHQIIDVQDHLYSLGRKKESKEKKAIQIYVGLIKDRGGSAIDCRNAHSFLQEQEDVRNYLRSNYHLADLTEFFANHPKYFVVDMSYVSIHPIWFITKPQFWKKAIHAPEQCVEGNLCGATSEKNTKGKKALDDEVAAVLRSVVMSSKGGIPLQKLQDDYTELVGMPIPFQESGYSSLESMLNDMQHVVRLNRSVSGPITVVAVDDPSTDHLTSLIARQKGSKPSTDRKISAPVRKISPQTAVKNCVPALERKAILFFAQKISTKRQPGEVHLINARAAKGFLTEAAEEIGQYVTTTYGGDLGSLFRRYPECFHLTKQGNIFPKPYKKILEFLNMKKFGFEVAERWKKVSEGGFPPPIP